MNLLLMIIGISVFIFDASFISLIKAEWKSLRNGRELLFRRSPKKWEYMEKVKFFLWGDIKKNEKNISQKHFDTDKYPIAVKGNFYLHSELNLADSGKRQLESIQLKEMEACLGFYFYIYGIGVKTLKIFYKNGSAIWTYTEHTDSWKFTETDIELSHMQNKFYIDAEAHYSNVVFALDEMTLRNGNCNATYSASVHMSKSEIGFHTDSPNVTRSKEKDSQHKGKDAGEVIYCTLAFLVLCVAYVFLRRWSVIDQK